MSKTQRLGLGLMIVCYMLWAVFYLQGDDSWTGVILAFGGGFGFVLFLKD